MADHVDPYRIYLDSARSQPLDQALADFYTNTDEAAEVANELDSLFAPFHTRTMAGRKHFAPSSAWRDELAMLPPGEKPSPQRFVVRVHLFEDSGGHAGRYLGFVSLHPPRASSYQKRAVRRANLDADVWRQLTDEELEGRFKGIHFQTFRNRVENVYVRKSLPFRSPRRAKL